MHTFSFMHTTIRDATLLTSGPMLIATLLAVPSPLKTYFKCFRSTERSWIEYLAWEDNKKEKGGVDWLVNFKGFQKNVYHSWADSGNLKQPSYSLKCFISYEIYFFQIWTEILTLRKHLHQWSPSPKWGAA